MTEDMSAAREYVPQVYRAPTPDEFRALLSKWELTGAAAGDLVGVKGRQIRRYTGGDADVPYAVLFTLAMKCEGIAVSIGRWRTELRLVGDQAAQPLTIEVDQASDEADEFAAWLREQGHTVRLVPQSVSTINGVPTTTPEASEQMRVLWEAYCDA